MDDKCATPIEVRPVTIQEVAENLDQWPGLRSPEGDRPRSVVAAVGTEIVGVATVGHNAVHPIRHTLSIEVAAAHRRRGIGSRLVDRLRAEGWGPFGVRAVPGSAEGQFLQRLGSVRYQTCPPQVVDTGNEAVLAWCDRHDQHETVDGTAIPTESLINYFARVYFWQHASWNPTPPVAELREQVGVPFADDTDLELSRFVVDGDRILAGCAIYADGLTSTTAFGAAEAADPMGAKARTQVASCMAATMRALGGRTVEFDGHITDPHFMPLLATVPGVSGEALELLELPA